MTTSPKAISDVAALAAIGAAARDLQLPRLRVEATRLADFGFSQGVRGTPGPSRKDAR